MITRSPARLPARPRGARAGARRCPIAGPRHKGVFPRRGGVRRPGPAPRREQAAGETQCNNYWSASSLAPNPTNPWIVNFNNGNVNNDDKTNNNYVRLARGGS